MLLLLNGCMWNTFPEDIDYFASRSPREIRQIIQKNDEVISKHFYGNTIPSSLRKAIRSNIRIYSALALSPSFLPRQIRISNNSATTSLFNPTQGYVYFYKDDLRYFNIHGVLIHESVGHPIDPHVYPVRRFVDILHIVNPSPLRLLELRAIASVPAVWQMLQNFLDVPYKPWNLLHPVAGSLDCDDVFNWFYVDERFSWEQASNLSELKSLVANFPTESLPHLLARIYLMILSNEMGAEELWDYVANENIFTIEARINDIIERNQNSQKALQQGLQKKYVRYLSTAGLKTLELTKYLVAHTKYTTTSNEIRIYQKDIGMRSITWYDHAPYGVSANDHMTWRFSGLDSFEDQGADGPNFENVLGNVDCVKDEYENLWKKCAALSELFLRE